MPVREFCAHTIPVGATVLDVDVSAPTGEGDALVLAVGTGGAEALVAAVEDSQGNPWQVVNVAGQSPRMSVWAAHGETSPLGGGDRLRVTLNPAATALSSLVGAACSDVAGLDVNVSAFAASLVAQVSGTPASEGQTALGCFVWPAGGGLVPARPPFTHLSQVLNSVRTSIAYCAGPPAGELLTAAYDLAASVAWRGVLVSFEAAEPPEPPIEPEPPEPPIDPEPPEPPEPGPEPPRRTLRRAYDREFDWAYDPRNVAPPLPEATGLIGVLWDGLSLNTGDPGIVENVEGWQDSPPLDGHDAPRSIADGDAWGPKTLAARTITIHGAATGQLDQLARFRDQLAARAAARRPSDLAISIGDRTLVAEVRAGTDAYRQHALGRFAFRYQVTLLAADPCLYDATWQSVALRPGTGEDSGRAYPTEYSWQYGQPYLPNAARLVNAGNHDAPVFALYEGDLIESRLVSDQGGIIRLAQLGAQMRIRVSTATLIAEAEGGLSRASYILPGSGPMTLGSTSTARWSLYSAGGGSVTLAWRSAWV